MINEKRLTGSFIRMTIQEKLSRWACKNFFCTSTLYNGIIGTKTMMAPTTQSPRRRGSHDSLSSSIYSLGIKLL